MFHPNLIPLCITLLLLPQVFVHGSLMKEVFRKFWQFFKWSNQRPGPFYYNCNLCSFGPCTPMVWPSNDDKFDPSAEAEKIKYELRSSNTYNEMSLEQKAALPYMFTEKSAPQRAAVAEAFQKKYNKLIVQELSNRISYMYRFHMFIRSISLPLPQFFDRQFQLAIIFLQKKDKLYEDQGQAIILEILTTLPKCLIDQVIALYNSNPGKDLSADLDKVLSDVGKPPAYREVIKKLVQQKRDTSQHASWINALKYSFKLKSAVISQRENEMKERFTDLFIQFSFPQIIETIVVYENLRQGDKEFQSLFDDIDKYKGEEKEVYKVMLRIFKNKPLYFAKTFEDIFKSGKKNTEYEERVVDLFVGRYDVDLKNIIDAYNLQSKTGFRADFEAWDISQWAIYIHPVFLNIIDKASRIPA